MNNVKVINDLIEKITGTNPKTTTDVQALNKLSEVLNGTNPKAKTNIVALKYIVDNYVVPNNNEGDEVDDNNL